MSEPAPFFPLFPQEATGPVMTPDEPAPDEPAPEAPVAVVPGPPAFTPLPPGAIIAHRGGALHAPEHTLDAYRIAAAHGIPVIEADAVTLADGTLGVMHDGTVDRTTTSSGNVADHTAASWRQLVIDAGVQLGGGWGDHRPPLLDDVLAEFAGRIPLTIEAKTGGTTMTALCDALDRYRVPPDAVLLQSFSRADCVTAVARGRPVAWLGTTDVPAAAASGIPWVAPFFPAATGELCAAVHAAGLKVAAWTVNRRFQRDALRAAGVDAIFSDDPAYLHSDAIRRRSDLFARGVWLPGHQTNTGNRGRFHPDGSWGYDLDGGRADFTLHGALGPTDPAAFTLDLAVRVDAVNDGDATRWPSLYLSGTDHAWADGPLPGAHGYHLLARANGVLAVYRITDGGNTLLAQDVAGPPLPPGGWVPLRVTVDRHGIRLERRDTGGAVTAADAAHRPLPFLTLGRNGAGVRFREVVFS